jgi:hypothetical protein
MALSLLLAMALFAQPWTRHTIDASSQGADGVKLADIDGDGRPDITTAWEEGGAIRVYRNPGNAARPWQQTTLGHVAAPEDAVFADLDNDGATDVVSSCEGKERKMFVHWAPKAQGEWKTEAIPASVDRMMWMFAQPADVDHRNGIDLIAGGKGPGAEIGWFESPANPRDLAAWRWHPLRPAGWVMSLQWVDMDGDGDNDILFSDRKGERSGVFWLENRKGQWTEHAIGSQGREVMFLDLADFDGDGRKEVLASVKPREVHVHKRHGAAWRTETIPFPETVVGTAKAVRLGDIDGDRRPDLVWSSEQAKGDLRGVVWMDQARKAHDISGPQGTKYDLIELVDMDGDGDLDVLTTEESERLGVIWYENPARQSRKM